MEFERGIKRIVTVLSILVGLISARAFFVYLVATFFPDGFIPPNHYAHSIFASFCVGVISCASVWLVYYLVLCTICWFRSEPMKTPALQELREASMQIECGIKKRVAVLSILVGLILGFALFAFFWVLAIGMSEPYEKGISRFDIAFFMSFCFGVICWACVWTIFYFLRWIVLVFCSDSELADKTSVAVLTFLLSIAWIAFICWVCFYVLPKL